MDAGSAVSYRVKLLALFLSGVAILIVLNVGYSALNTLSRLNAVEADRDRWQRPSDVVQALNPRPGNTVVDLGCGSGYFTLKLSSPVGKTGHVFAEDIRWLPLAFLWVRTIVKEHNVSLIHGKPTDPELPINTVNAVLISNTYHELTDPKGILSHVSRSLVSGGLLVVVDREPNPANVGVTESGEHEVSVERVELDLRQAGFEIVSRQDHFIESDPDSETWWLLVARRP
jgi:ubiquinone/menaquinone biosynthesis C-methylase UbiE